MAKNTGRGETTSKILMMIMEDIDPFMDSYSNDLFACHAMIDSMKVSSDNTVTVTFSKEFLMRLTKSHIRFIRGIL